MNNRWETLLDSRLYLLRIRTQFMRVRASASSFLTKQGHGVNRQRTSCWNPCSD